MTNYKIIAKDLFLDAFWETVYFPVWWYSQGAKKLAFFCLERIKGAWQVLAIGVLLLSFFKPMYGTKGWDAYLLSLATHFLQILWRFLAILIWLLFWLAVALAWLILPVWAIYQIII